MKNKTQLTIILAFLVVMLFAGCAEKVPECAKEGERIGADVMPERCCEGLKDMWGWPGGYDGNCSLIPPPGGLGICSNCGDGICTPETRENICNCPEDCS